MPKLKSALEYDLGDNYEDPGLKIEAWNTPIDITLPALEKVDSLSIEGTSITRYITIEHYSQKVWGLLINLRQPEPPCP